MSYEGRGEKPTLYLSSLPSTPSPGFAGRLNTGMNCGGTKTGFACPVSGGEGAYGTLRTKGSQSVCPLCGGAGGLLSECSPVKWRHMIGCDRGRGEEEERARR